MIEIEKAETDTFQAYYDSEKKEWVILFNMHCFSAGKQVSGLGARICRRVPAEGRRAGIQQDIWAIWERILALARALLARYDIEEPSTIIGVEIQRYPNKVDYGINARRYFDREGEDFVGDMLFQALVTETDGIRINNRQTHGDAQDHSALQESLRGFLSDFANLAMAIRYKGKSRQYGKKE